MILLDTNLLARLADTEHPHFIVARQALARLDAMNEEVVIVPQSLFEFHAVATRRRGAPPAGSNGLGMNASESGAWLSLFRQQFALLPDQPDLVDQWQRLVIDRGITGFRAHDARFVAAMRTHRIDRILTFNGKDFVGLGVTVVDPSSFGG